MKKTKLLSLLALFAVMPIFAYASQNHQQPQEASSAKKKTPEKAEPSHIITQNMPNSQQKQQSK